ncbi:MAG: histone deacetylase [bacterium]|jgi:acetoin utilization deacetylase AcuC-like enzyme|nr:histone deacetylase [Planctomycetota bacterium]HIL52194.1 histone deacetylase [Planctomycetota bacterium]
MQRTGWVSSQIFLQHDTGPGHLECPGRLQAIWKALAQSGRDQVLDSREPRQAGLDEIGRVHQGDYVQRVQATILDGATQLDPDTPVSPGSWKAALAAAGGAIEACERVLAGEWKNAFLAARPPGHHAEYESSMGFCIFNTAMIAARHLQAKLDIERVAILDWDVHHGNGSQHLSERDPSIFYASVHQAPHFPGTGAREERGLGAGEGTVLNVPLAAGAGDEEFVAALEDDLLPAIEEFDPEFLIISAGFDAHAGDPLSDTRVTDAGFMRMGQAALALAGRAAEGRVLTVLEGGYNLECLSRTVNDHLGLLLEA